MIYLRKIIYNCVIISKGSFTLELKWHNLFPRLWRPFLFIRCFLRMNPVEVCFFGRRFLHDGITCRFSLWDFRIYFLFLDSLFDSPFITKVVFYMMTECYYFSPFFLVNTVNSKAFYHCCTEDVFAIPYQFSWQRLWELSKVSFLKGFEADFRRQRRVQDNIL